MNKLDPKEYDWIGFGPGDTPGEFKFIVKNKEHSIPHIQQYDAIKHIDGTHYIIINECLTPPIIGYWGKDIHAAGRQIHPYHISEIYRNGKRIWNK